MVVVEVVAWLFVVVFAWQAMNGKVVAANGVRDESGMIVVNVTISSVVLFRC